MGEVAPPWETALCPVIISNGAKDHQVSWGGPGWQLVTLLILSPPAQPSGLGRVGATAARQPHPAARRP